MSTQSQSQPASAPTTQPARNGPLHGIRILDLSRVLAAPWCMQILGDLGADIVKIERPGPGDESRHWGPPWLNDADGKATKESAYFLSTNRNKRSVAVDLASPIASQSPSRSRAFRPKPARSPAPVASPGTLWAPRSTTGKSAPAKGCFETALPSRPRAAREAGYWAKYARSP